MATTTTAPSTTTSSTATPSSVSYTLEEVEAAAVAGLVSIRHVNCGGVIGPRVNIVDRRCQCRNSSKIPEAGASGEVPAASTVCPENQPVDLSTPSASRYANLDATQHQPNIEAATAAAADAVEHANYQRFATESSSPHLGYHYYYNQHQYPVPSFRYYNPPTFPYNPPPTQPWAGYPYFSSYYNTNQGFSTNVHYSRTQPVLHTTPTNSSSSLANHSHSVGGTGAAAATANARPTLHQPWLEKKKKKKKKKTPMTTTTTQETVPGKAVPVSKPGWGAGAGGRVLGGGGGGGGGAWSDTTTNTTTSVGGGASSNLTSSSLWTGGEGGNFDPKLSAGAEARGPNLTAAEGSFQKDDEEDLAEAIFHTAVGSRFPGLANRLSERPLPLCYARVPHSTNNLSKRPG